MPNSHADPTPSFTHVGKLGSFCFTFIRSKASLQCFSFLINGKGGHDSKYFWLHSEIFSACIDTDPDQHLLDADPDQGLDLANDADLTQSSSGS
jgi:hypothetical protein